MKKTLLFSFLSVFLFSGISNAGNYNFPIGARQGAMGNASVGFNDFWSLWGNQAGLTGVKNITAGLYYEDKFFMPSLGLKAGGVAIPVGKLGVFGFSMNSFGYDLYSEKKAGIAFAKSYANIVSVGMQLDYIGTSIAENYGSVSALVAEFGMQAKVLKELTIGAHVYNPTRSKLVSYNDERIPTQLRIGMVYNFSKAVL